MNDKEVKMKLLEELMSEMDETSASKLKPKDEVQVTEIEQKEMPLEDVKEMLAEKMGAADTDDIDLSEDEESEVPFVSEDEYDDDESLDEDEEIAEGDIPYQGGRLAEKLKALKKLRG